MELRNTPPKRTLPIIEAKIRNSKRRYLPKKPVPPPVEGVFSPAAGHFDSPNAEPEPNPAHEEVCLPSSLQLPNNTPQESELLGEVGSNSEEEVSEQESEEELEEELEEEEEEEEGIHHELPPSVEESSASVVLNHKHASLLTQSSNQTL